MSTIYSYDLNGKKLSFANWISNLSPEETPFCSMTKKEKVNQTMFQWQSDYLNPSGTNATVEGAQAVSRTLGPTSSHHNYTQILRKVVKVSDTADSIASYGRDGELTYQAMKAGKEMKRDLEWAFMNNKLGNPGDNLTPRETSGFRGLVAQKDTVDHSTGAVVYKEFSTPLPTYEDLIDMMYNLYLSGSKANIIMYHPKFAAFFSALQESKDNGSNKVRLFENTQLLDLHVKEIVSPWCQRFKLVPNRWIESNSIFFFNPEDFTQMVLREPKRTPLAKAGSSEKLLFEMEVGLRLKNPFAAGVLENIVTTRASIFEGAASFVNATHIDKPNTEVSVATGSSVKVKFELAPNPSLGFLPTAKIQVFKNGKNTPMFTKNDVPFDELVEFELYKSIGANDASDYRVVVSCGKYFDDKFTFNLVTA